MTTKYNVGDKVLVEAEITKIHIDKDGVKYHVTIKTDSNSNYTGLFAEDSLHELDEDTDLEEGGE